VDDEHDPEYPLEPQGEGEPGWHKQIGHLRALMGVAAAAAGTLRDVVVRSSQAGRLRVDMALYMRERRDLYAALGKRVLELVAAGSLSLPDDGTTESLLARLHEVQAQIDDDSARVNDNAFGAPRG
jgi:hypothetical protein